MTPEPNADSSWDRVAAELRACRETQQRAWGDIDNTTLGRFLAGEVTPEEQRQIENALDTLPELRKLTDLVREVLAEPEAAVLSPALSGPTVVPFPQPQLQARTIVPSSEWNTAGPARDRKRWLRDPRFQQRVGLALAACLLLALGLMLPRTKSSAAPEAGFSMALLRPVADRRMPIEGDGAGLAQVVNASGAFGFRDGDEEARLGLRGKALLARVDASVRALEAEGKKQEAESLARQYVNNLTRQALVYQEKGDLDRAEPALNQARLLCTRTLGPQAPETTRTSSSLAGVYELALNTPSPSPYLDALGSSSPPPAAAKDQDLFGGVRRDTLRLMAKASPPPPAPAVASEAAPSSPVRSASAYVAPNAPHRFAMPPPGFRPTQKPKSGGYARHHGHLPSGGQAAAFALCQRITHQSQKEVKSSVVPVLAQALRETQDVAERRRLARALGRLGPAAADAVPPLLDAYRSATDPSERAALILALGQIGPAARQAVPVLVDSLHSDSPEVRKCAARALVRLGPGVRRYGDDLAQRKNADPLLGEVLQRLDGPEGRSDIDDAAECFSVEAVQQGREAVVRLAKQAHLEVRIETVHGWKGMKKRTETLRHGACPHCVHLYINKDAPAMQVFVSEALRKQGLIDAQLREAMGPYLHRPDFDRALEAGIRCLADFETKRVRK
ncbi:MAG TPA: HEAT repeat domain-containing protein [Gemmataceae bacterium]|nr:HEAT repeat domain-containing protein [Gemmataceae bacterium]